MKVTKELADKVNKCNELFEEARRLYEEIEREILSLDENYSMFYITNFYVSDKPIGEPCGEGEYHSADHYGEDSISGVCCHPIVDGDKYLAVCYEG